MFTVAAGVTEVVHGTRFPPYYGAAPVSVGIPSLSSDSGHERLALRGSKGQ
jgi:hypothetical protein